jgi:hypothetical protein
MDALPPRSDARDERTAPAASSVDQDPGGRMPGAPSAPEEGGVAVDGGPYEPSTTASQLRRFIKSRPWVPMHELRRRFGIVGTDDEMTGVDFEGGRIFLGLPPREASLLGELIRQGEVGFELVHDPDCPAVAGVFPMRPVARP